MYSSSRIIRMARSIRMRSAERVLDLEDIGWGSVD
jgi:hypothetical protein